MTNVPWDSERRRLRPQFIRRASAYMDGTKIWEKGGFARDEVALRTLVRVADESIDIEEVLHFVRAKIGQTEPGRKWRYRDFGESLIRELTDGLAAVRKEIEERLARPAGDGEIAVHVSRWFVAAALEHYRYRREVERARAEQGVGRDVAKERGEKRERPGGRDAKKRVFGDGTAVKRRGEDEVREKRNHGDTEALRSGEEEKTNRKELAGADAGVDAEAVAGAGSGGGAGTDAVAGAGADEEAK